MKTQFLLFHNMLPNVVNLLDLHFRYIENISRALTWNEIYPTKQIDKLIKNVNEMKETF